MPDSSVLLWQIIIYHYNRYAYNEIIFMFNYYIVRMIAFLKQSQLSQMYLEVLEL